jgi:hypothetical protein
MYKLTVSVLEFFGVDFQHFLQFADLVGLLVSFFSKILEDKPEKNVTGLNIG